MTLDWSLVVPARNAEQDIAHIVHCGHRAGARQVIVVENASLDHTARHARHAGAVVITSPAGKGNAVKAGIRHAARYRPDAVVTSDADLWALEPALLRQLAEIAVRAPVRGEWDRPGRAGHQLPKLLDACDLDPNGLSPAALLSGLAGYPLPFPLTLTSLPNDYGWDLATALDLQAAGHRIHTVPAGPRHHRPGDTARIETIMAALHRVCAARSPGPPAPWKGGVGRRAGRCAWWGRGLGRGCGDGRTCAGTPAE
jgi:glycosyltransferase involved in cell wall biosynthesis